jgi:CHAT domain-containing protein
MVEAVAAKTEAERIGFAAGDVILRWSRGGSGGEINSPIDLFEVEIEQLPRGPISLSGRRGTQEKSWLWTESTNWSVREGDWGLTARPNLQGRVVERYQTGQKAAESGKPAEAGEIWKALADDNQTQGLRLSAWLLLRSAQMRMLASDWEQAEATCQKAAPLPGSALTKVTLLRICGDSLDRAKQTERAERVYRQALAEAQQSLPGSLAAASLLTVIGRMVYGRDEMTPGMDLISQALQIQQKLAPESLVTAATLHRLGTLCQWTGKLKRSEELLEQALAIRERHAPESTAVAVTLESLGDTSTILGDVDKGLLRLVRSSELWQKLQPDSLFVAGSLVDLSNVWDEIGDRTKAEDCLRRALSIQRKLKPRGGGVAYALNNLGLLVQEEGQLAQAEALFNESMDILKEIAPESQQMANAIGNLGNVYRSRGNLEKADQYVRRALAMREKVGAGTTEQANDYVEAGDLAVQRKDFQAAEDFYRKGLAVARASAPGGLQEADTLQSLADLAFKRGQVEEAEKNYQAALELAKKSGSMSGRYAEALLAQAEVARRKQQTDGAATLFEQGLAVLESHTSRLGGSSDFRAGFRARYENHYKSYVDLLIAQGKTERAFQVLERSRGRTLVEMLAEGHIDIRTGTDPELLQRERTLNQAVAIRSDRRVRMLAQEHTEEEVAALDREIQDLLGQAQVVQGQIQASSPNYAALTLPQPLSAAQVQQQLLEDDTVLLEYSLGAERSQVFVLTRSSLATVELPDRAAIEKQVRKVYQLLTARSHLPKGETPLQRQTRLAAVGARYSREAAALSRMILGPVSASLKSKRLLVVTDGALAYVPFASLPSPGRTRPLLVEHEVVNLPSASVLAELRKQENGRQRAPKTVAVLADPVFDEQDARIKAGPDRGDGGSLAQTEDLRSSELLTRSAGDVGVAHPGILRFSRLPFSRREAAAIVAAATPGQAMSALDFRASRVMAMSPELSQYRIVHFATHGLLDSKHPELSGLVWSLVDRQGKPQSGFLGLEDVYNLNLPVDLVVLSACETGLGQQIDGEGLMGLTRGFMYAGAGAVVASLWRVDDVATANLMGRFYRAMLHDRLPPASALSRAQLEMRRQERWADPYYWGGFVIQGEWKKSP